MSSYEWALIQSDKYFLSSVYVCMCVLCVCVHVCGCMCVVSVCERDNMHVVVRGQL